LTGVHTAFSHDRYARDKDRASLQCPRVRVGTRGEVPNVTDSYHEEMSTWTGILLRVIEESSYFNPSGINFNFLLKKLFPNCST